MQCDFIKIQNIEISGTINPLLKLKGTYLKENYNLITEIDGKEIFSDLLIDESNSEFILTTKLPRNAKRIKVFIEIDDEKLLVYYANSNIIKRILKRLKQFCFSKIHRAIHILGVFARGIKYLWKEYHFLVPPSMIPKLYKELIDSIKRRTRIALNPANAQDYRKWLSKNEKEIELKEFKYQPLISIITPVYNISSKLLKECIESVLNQSYQNFELCLVDDASTNQDTINTLKEYENKDSRIKIKYRSENGHISVASNDAVKMATGEFIALLDNDDLLHKNALYYVVEALNNDKKIDLIYTDEDKLSLSGERCEPHFKPDWSPNTLLSLNYICHFTVIRKKMFDSVGGFEVGLEGAQDYDLILKITEKTKNIKHIPKVLYHWRKTYQSTALSMNNKNYANDKGKHALENALKRRNIKGHVLIDYKTNYYQIKYDISEKPLVSIIIPTRDYLDITKACIDSIYEKTTYDNFEIILANNDSKEEKTLAFFKEYQEKYDNFKVIDIIMDFNYSKINNIAVENSQGEYILLLNNDTEVITPDWIEIMVGYAKQSHIGCVGVKLLYPDTTVQHAGVILGACGGVASHAYIGASRDDKGLYGRLRVPYDYSANTAACLMIKREKYYEVNGLNEELKVAYNDIDFNIKLLNKGYFNVFLPQVELTHHESKSRGLDTTSEKYKRFLQESQYMYDKWGKLIENDRYYNPNFTLKYWFMLDKDSN